jgi:multidrug transporter EmrE-like cation transporter
MLAGALWLREPLSWTNTGGLALIAAAVVTLTLGEAWARRA